MSAGTMIEMVDDFPFDRFGIFGVVSAVFPMRQNWNFVPGVKCVQIEYAYDRLIAKNY